jgi:hypothetical protein
MALEKGNKILNNNVLNSWTGFSLWSSESFSRGVKVLYGGLRRN